MMRRFSLMSPRPLIFVACALAAPGVVMAQPAVVSQPVVQPTTGGATSPGQALNSALGRLARDPRNLTALLDAGSAALQLGDTDAAVGFFKRANEVAPGNGQVKAQIGMAMLRADNPLEAIAYFDDAEREGADIGTIAADRGLAYDLVGDNAAAQRYYQFALARGSNDEVLRRYALSLAIAGDRRAAEATIAPLVQRQDRAAWRVRTFIMAITGSAEEAVSVAYASMPQDLAGGIAPYLRFMGRLTPAQQAAAANLGRFPRAADIGRDDPRIVQYAALHPRAPKVDAGLTPAGEPLGGKGKQLASRDAPSRDKRRRPDRAPTAAPSVTQVPALTQPPVAARTVVAAPPATMLAMTPAPSPMVAPRAMVSTPVVQPVVQPTPSPATPVPATPPTQIARPTSAPGFDLARTPGSQAVPQPYPLARIDMPPQGVPRPVASTTKLAPSPVPTIAPQPVTRTPAPSVVTPQAPVSMAAAAPPPADDFSALFDSFKAPEAEQQAQRAAVDLSTIRPGRPAPAPQAKVAPIAAKEAKEAKVATTSRDPRGERPDAPSAVSRVTEREVRVADSKDKNAKTDKTAKDTKSGKDAKSARDAKAEKGKSAKPSHPSRIWVQVLSGGNREVMGKEWRKLVKDASALKGRKPYISPLRANFRLLTGPFDSDADAQNFVKSLKKDGVSSYQWTSPAGQPVDTLSLD